MNLSSQGADRSAGTGPILGLADQEKRLNLLLGVNIVHLRPTYFMENLLANIPLINRQGIAGSAIRGDVKFAMIATRDIAAHVATLLVNRGFRGSSTRDLLGERELSLNEAVSVIGREIGAIRFLPRLTASCYWHKYRSIWTADPHGSHRCR